MPLPKLRRPALLALTLALISAAPLAAQSKPRYLGVSTCMGAACHCKPHTSDQPAWQSAATVWAHEDPHGNAFATLLSDRSRQILQRLAASGADAVSAAHVDRLQQRCTGCHATPAATVSSTASLLDGVSCEACHGPAEKWLSAHTQSSWTTLSPAKKRSDYGFADTLDLSSRAAVCARCHVGPGVGPDGSHQDVNHDLIAAGHPRLNFEFNAYLASLPPHWDAQRDRAWADKRQAVRRANFPLEAWRAGQLAVAQAALELLGTRADSAAQGGIWPEFAEYDCVSCHHGLRPEARGLHRSRPTPGKPDWGGWHFAFAEVLSRQQSQDRFPASLELLKREMTQAAPNPQGVLPLVEDASRELTALRAADWSKQQPADLIDALRASSNGLQRWDQFAQWYLAVEAAVEARAEPLGDNARDTAEALRAFRQRLESNVAPPELERDLKRLLDQLGELE